MENLEKLNFALARIKAVKGNIAAKRDRIKYYTESIKDSTKWDQITFEKLESFNFEQEVINRQRCFDLQKKCKSRLKPYSLQEFTQELEQIKNLAKTV
jgi:hypothetical protein